MNGRRDFPLLWWFPGTIWVDTRGPRTNKQFSWDPKRDPGSGHECPIESQAKIPVAMNLYMTLQRFSFLSGKTTHAPKFRLSWYECEPCPPHWRRCSFNRPRTCPHFPRSSGSRSRPRTTTARIRPPSQPCRQRCPPLHHWHRRKRRPTGRLRRRRWSRPSKASPELRPRRRSPFRSCHLFRQRRRQPPNLQVGAPNAGGLVDLNAGNDGHGMARVVILFENCLKTVWSTG